MTAAPGPARSSTEYISGAMQPLGRQTRSRRSASELRYELAISLPRKSRDVQAAQIGAARSGVALPACTVERRRCG